MALCSVDVVKKMANFLKVPTGTVAYNTDKVITRTRNKEITEGFLTTILKLASESDAKDNVTREEDLLMFQWLEFTVSYSDEAGAKQTYAKTYLSSINDHLEQNSYLIGAKRTIADIVLYHVIYNLFKSLSVAEKEQFIHLSRWFELIQSDDLVRQGNAYIKNAAFILSQRSFGMN